jgi:hypothetical protein
VKLCFLPFLFSDPHNQSIDNRCCNDDRRSTVNTSNGLRIHHIRLIESQSMERKKRFNANSHP